MTYEFFQTDESKDAMLNVALDNAVRAFERGQAALYRNDKPIHGPEIHEEKAAALAVELRAAFDDALGTIESERLTALSEANAAEHADPTAQLSPTAMAFAASRAPFVRDDLRTLPPAALASRLQAVAENNDKETLWIYWRQCETLAAELAAPVTSPLRDGVRMDVPTDTAERVRLLRQAAKNLAHLLDPDRAERAAVKRARAEVLGRKRFEVIRRLQEIDGTAAKQRADGLRRTMATF